MFSVHCSLFTLHFVLYINTMNFVHPDRGVFNVCDFDMSLNAIFCKDSLRVRSCVQMNFAPFLGTIESLSTEIKLWAQIQ